jgi:hypothetical protein
MSYSSNGNRPKLSEKGLLTPDNCVVALIDHQGQMLFGTSNFDRQGILRMKFTSNNAKESICRKRFGLLVRFAFSGMNNAGSALCAIPKSLGSRVGACTTAFPV